jgi:hypothetical protein
MIMGLCGSRSQTRGIARLYRSDLVMTKPLHRATPIARILSVLSLALGALLLLGEHPAARAAFAPGEEQAGNALKAASGTAVITVSTRQGAAGDEVSAPILLTTNDTEPSLIAFKLTYDVTKLTFKGVTTGAAAAAADKVVDHNSPEPGVEVFIAWGLNTNIIGDGEIAVVRFAILPASDTGVVYLAASDASVAVPVGDGVGSVPVQLVYYAPAAVSASQGRADGVLVEWSVVPAATEYRVYRSDADDPDTAQPLTDWLASPLSYLDTSAAQPEATGGGCAGSQTFVYDNLYYWVRAGNASDGEGSLSVSALGYRGAAKALDAQGQDHGTALGASTAPPTFGSGVAGDILVMASVAGMLLMGMRKGRERRAPR